MTDTQHLITSAFERSLETKRTLVDSQINELVEVVELVTHTFKNGQKVLLCGNGGSAADAQHIAAEWVTRYKGDRKALPAIALTVNTSDLTAIGNDYGFDDLFSRQVEAHGQSGDLLIAISTSGNSANVVKAVHTAKNYGLRTLGLTGQTGGKLKSLCDVCLCVPSNETARIQEAHTTIMHAMCEHVDNVLFGV